MQAIGILLIVFVAAVPAAVVVAVLMMALDLGRATMWKLTVLLLSVPMVLAIWADLRSDAAGGSSELTSLRIILLLLPVLAIAGALHYADGEGLSTRSTIAIAMGAGSAAFAIAVIWMLQGIYTGVH